MFLDEWIKNNTDKLQISSDNRDLSDEQKKEIIELQDEEANMLQALIDKLQQKEIDEEIEEK